jgi:hypothetical protein
VLLANHSRCASITRFTLSYSLKFAFLTMRDSLAWASVMARSTLDSLLANSSATACRAGGGTVEKKSSPVASAVYCEAPILWPSDGGAPCLPVATMEIFTCSLHRLHARHQSPGRAMDLEVPPACLWRP